jgi:tetratricopeptide (TPR) repeat protein
MSSDLPANLRALIESSDITDICFNRHDQIFYDSGQGTVPYEGIPIFAGETEYRNFVLEQISKSGKTWDAKLPFVDTVFFQTHRAHVAFPPLAQLGIYLSLRKLPRKQNVARMRAQTEAQVRWKDSSDAFELLKQATLAIDCYSSALEAADKEKSPESYASLKVSIGIAQVDLAEICFKEKRYDEAISACDRAIACYNEALRIYEGSGKEKQAAPARKYLKEANDLFNTFMMIGSGRGGRQLELGDGL